MPQRQKPASLTGDIRTQLENALSTQLDFVGTFSFSKTHIDAPNPSLKIEGIGIVGVPLSTGDAQAIKLKSQAEQAPFGKGRRRRRTRPVEDTCQWEIDAKLVTFANPQWETFMQTSVEAACKVLGVNHSASRPRCDPYKLFLYGTGSHFLARRVDSDTERVDGKFATIMVVLPSEFSGGETHLSHSGVSITYDCGETSLNTTTFMAWYSDVGHEIRPIKSGYRLAISFNLIHTTNSLCPAISTNSRFIEEVKRVLLRWKEIMKKDDVPKKIVYLLDRQYSEAPSRRSAPTGVDDVKVALLQQICREIDCSLGTATVIYTLSGSVYGKGYWGCDHDALEFSSVDDREMSFEDFVGLDGTTLSHTLWVDEDTETIPVNFAGDVESGKHAGQDREGRCLSRWYTRTVLVVWPTQNIYDAIHTYEDIKRVCEELEKAGDSKPSERSVQLAEYVLSRVEESPDKVFTTVCSAALRWKDNTLWCRALETHFCHNPASLLDPQDLEEAIKTFGFHGVNKCLEKALTTSPSNRRALELITLLEKMTKGNPGLEEDCGDETISEWISKQRDTVLRNLRKFNKGDVTIVIQSSISHGGLVFLRECVVPQLLAQLDSRTLVDLASEINKTTIEDMSTKTELISKLVITAVTKFNFFSAPGSTPNAAKNADPVLENFKKFTQICCILGCADALILVLEKATLTTGLSPADASKRARTVMLPLLDYIGLQPRALSAFPETSVKALAEATIPLILSQPNEMNGALTRSMVNAAKMTGGGLDLIQTTIIPVILSSGTSADTQLVLAEEITKLGTSVPEGTGEDFSARIRSMTTPLVSKVAQNAALNTSNIINILSRLVKLGDNEGCTIIIQRAIGSAHQANAIQLQQTFTPLLSPLRKIALSYPSLERSINTLLRTVVEHWVKIVLGQNPPEDRSTLVSLSPWTCTCVHCQRAKAFLQGDSADNPSLRMDCIGAQARKHLERFLTSCTSRAVTFTTTTGRSQGILINLSDNMKQFLPWKRNQVFGIKMLRGITTDEAQLQGILGDYYKVMLQALGIRRVTAGAAVPPGTNQVAVASTSANAAASGATTQINRTGEPPAKKRKIISDPASIIDLT